MRLLVLASLLAAMVTAAGRAAAADAPQLDIDEQADRLVVTHGGRPVATYVFRDAETLRPYFAHVHTPAGQPVTRNHPPREGVDAADHATMHPGLWLAFGELGGGDFWRNKGRVEFVEFIERPAVKLDGKESVVTFAAKYRYVADDKTVCHETARHSIRARSSDFLITFDSELSGDELFVLGDQEEMGLGVRLATPLVVKNGSGMITNSEGRKNEKEVWGRQADWCAYGGVLELKTPGDGFEKVRSGLLIVPHPSNFRRSWMHARDYGVLVANPFGQKAFTGGEISRVEVRPGEKLRLRFGIWSYSAGEREELDYQKMAAAYVRWSEELAGGKPVP